MGSIANSVNPLSSARKQSGLTIKKLSEITEIDETQIRKWERNLSTPDSSSIKKLCITLNISMSSVENYFHHAQNNKTLGEGYRTSKAGNGVVTERTLVPPNNKLKVMDLFCGCGGLSYGFEQSKYFVTTLGIDLLPDRIASFTANHKYAKGIAGDILTYSLDEIETLAGDIDIIVGGPPCQGFSSIRPFRMLTEDDPRNNLVEKYVLIINKLKPKWFVFENVVGLLRHEHRARYEALISGLKDA